MCETQPVLGYVPPDPLVEKVHDFLVEYGRDEHAEVEVKFGILLDRNVLERLIVVAGGHEGLGEVHVRHGSQFQADVDTVLFRRLNEALNRCVQSQGRRVAYRHAHHTDFFYQDGKGRIRVAIDDKTLAPIEAIRKQRAAVLNIACPFRQIDWRVSAAMEIPVSADEIPEGKDPVMRRKKDRMSYQWDMWSLDLTRVDTLHSEIGTQKTTHEVELEADKERMHTACRENGKELWRIAQALVNNVRAILKSISRPPRSKREREEEGQTGHRLKTI